MLVYSLQHVPLEEPVFALLVRSALRASWVLAQLAWTTRTMMTHQRKQPTAMKTAHAPMVSFALLQTSLVSKQMSASLKSPALLEMQTAVMMGRSASRVS
jgi:hypothetical protein